MTDDRIRDIGHRYAWRYKHSSDPNHSSTYTFNEHCLRDFARAIERELSGGDSHSRVTERKPNGEPSNYARGEVESRHHTFAQNTPAPGSDS